MFGGVRVLIAVGAGLLFLGGLVAISSGQPDAAFAGSWAVVAGMILALVLAFERSRYRSESADRHSDTPGPGGGEPLDALEPRFQRTEEIFMDPTSGRRMRVFMDPRTGERRYRAEA